MTPNEKFEQAKVVIENFNEEVTKYTTKNKLAKLPPFSELQNKESIGNIYRDDQIYYETLSGFRSKYFGMSAFFLKLKTETNDRVLTRKIDDMAAYLDKKLSMLANMVFESKDRVKFYQNVIYLVANMSYGDY
jgi:hypothetical protein